MECLKQNQEGGSQDRLAKDDQENNRYLQVCLEVLQLLLQPATHDEATVSGVLIGILLVIGWMIICYMSAL